MNKFRSPFLLKPFNIAKTFTQAQLTLVWSRLNSFARLRYRVLARRSPKTAEIVKKALYPVLLFANRIILRSNHAQRQRRFSGQADTVMLFQDQDPQLNYRPLVSILVPNFNHAQFLEKRLESIFSQTYDNFEVLLMDDCSTDSSREILVRYAEKFPDKTHTIFNSENSGGVFFQWEKGLKEARGDLIWIAESDDWASENLLEEMVPFFRNSAVQLAYARTSFMDNFGKKEVWSMEASLDGLDKTRWEAPFVTTAPEIVRSGFAERNIIPNVSSAVFRKVERLGILENDIWRTMRTCGDWLFYLNSIRGGCIAYSPAATNYYRLHDQNTSRTAYSDDSFYLEHEVIAKSVLSYYDVPSEILERQCLTLQDHWRANRRSYSSAAFDQCYSLDRIIAEHSSRKPNLLMAGGGFCAGGGETFPIQLANLMKTAGYNVTFLDFALEPEVPEVRAMLAADIPVVTDVSNINEICRAFDIDIIHSHHTWVDNIILDLLPDNSRVKTVVTLHGMYETIPKSALNAMLPRLVQRTSKIVYTADKNLEALRQSGLIDGREIKRIDNALEIRPVSPVDRADFGIPERAFVLTIVARAIESKGWLEAIAAVELARGMSDVDIHLVLIGEGPIYDNLLSSGVSEFIHMVGFRSNIRDFFAMSDLGFLPSRFKGESFPLVLIDCLHSGRPLLASDVGEIPYMLSTDDGPAGELFDLDGWKINVHDLAERIARLAEDDQQISKMRRRVSSAAAKFDPVLMRDAYDQIYVSTLE